MHELLASVVAVDKSLSSSLSDAREALINAAVDMLSAYRATLSSAAQYPGQLLSSYQLRLIPLYALALLKSVSCLFFIFMYGELTIDVFYTFSTVRFSHLLCSNDISMCKMTSSLFLCVNIY